MSRASRLTVRARLTLWNVAVVGIALTLFAFALRFGVHRILLGTVDRDLAARMTRDMRDHEERRRRSQVPENDSANVPLDAGRPGGPADDPGGRNDDPSGPPPGPQESPGGSAAGSSVGGSALRPHRLHVVDGEPSTQDPAAYSMAGFHEAVRTGRDVWTTDIAEGQKIRVLSRPAHPPGVREIHIIQMPTAIDFVDAADRGVTTTMLLLIPAALLLTGIGGTLLTNRALRPVDDLARLLSRIQAQNLKERLPDANASDEFGRLSGVVNAMLARLEDAFERQNRFAADASHELRTPLATIRTSSSLALDPSLPPDAFTPEQYRGLLRRIDEAADRATRVTQDLLFLARVGALPVRRERLSLHGVLSEAHQSVLTAFRLSPRAADRTALPEIRIDAPEDLRVDSDRDHLLRLFINLIDNAARHTPETGRVLVQAQRVGDATTIRVVDTGEGIPPEHLARIREPFYRPDNARSRRGGGAGLGLAITQGIVDALGGTLHIDSIVGQGTTVTVTLPENRLSDMGKS